MSKSLADVGQIWANLWKVESYKEADLTEVDDENRNERENEENSVEIIEGREIDNSIDGSKMKKKPFKEFMWLHERRKHKDRLSSL